MKSGTRKRTQTKGFLFSRKSPTKTRNLYTNNNPNNTISIKFSTVDDVRNTILLLEQLYSKRVYSHLRISQVALVLKNRLGVLKQKKPAEYTLAKRYSEFLKKRTLLSEEKRHSLVFV